MKSRFSWLALFALLLSSPALAQGTDAPSLQPGDTVRVTVWNRPELSGSFLVGGDGTIRHPLFSTVVVAGVPVAAAQGRVAAVVARYQANPQIVVDALFRVAVGGEVRRPGLYSLPPETSIAQVVALAGGVTEAGRARDVRLLRGGVETRIDLAAPATALAPIRSGDQIFVERRTNVFREYIAPVGGLVAALAAVANLIVNN